MVIEFAELPPLCLHFKCIRKIDHFMNVKSSPAAQIEE
jgi:hypothetical protein